MNVKIVTTRGKSFGSYIDYGTTTIEVENIIPETKLGNFDDGYTLRYLLEKLGHNVEFKTNDAYADNIKIIDHFI